MDAATASPPALARPGGIGITPLYAMAQHLEATGRPFELHYYVKSREVIDGDVDHRDTVQSDGKKAPPGSISPCVAPGAGRGTW